MSKHWSNEDLINRLYGIGPDDSHLHECEECRVRWLQVQASRSIVLQEPRVAPDFLVRQREAIEHRLNSEQSHSWGFRLAPAMAALGVVVLGLVLSQPTPAPQPTLASVSPDSEFYTEIYAMVESSEPWVAESMYGLFEED
jgi:hypothetical protein